MKNGRRKRTIGITATISPINLSMSISGICSNFNGSYRPLLSLRFSLETPAQNGQVHPPLSLPAHSPVQAQSTHQTFNHLRSKVRQIHRIALFDVLLDKVID